MVRGRRDRSTGGSHDRPGDRPRHTDVEVDAELLQEAQRQIAAPSRNAAMNEALRRVVNEERAKRETALDAIRQMIADGELDFRPVESIDE
ncbi:MAG: type II toxin-antitoxin system VapB family antitoxin [Actinoplanes sp.]